MSLFKSVGLFFCFFVFLVNNSLVYSSERFRFGVDVPYEPMSYKSPDGVLSGFDIELGDALCEELGFDCEWVVQEWDGLVPGLMARNFDAIMSAMTITNERRQSLLFSEPYLSPLSAAFSHSNNNIASISQDDMRGVNIGVQRGTLQDNFVTDIFLRISNINRYSTVDDLVLDMHAGRIDVAFLDYPVGKITLVDSGVNDYKLVGDMITEPEEYFGEGFGIAFRSRDNSLVNDFNEALMTIKSNGVYDAIYERYFK